MCSERNNKGGAIHFGKDRKIKRDEFELCLSQAFVGPVELKLNQKEFVPLRFSYVDVGTKEDHFPPGTVNFCCLVKNDQQLILRIMLQFIEGIQVYPPINGTNSTGAIVMKIANRGCFPLRRSLGISKGVAQSYPLTFPSAGDVFSSVIFILKPWNEVNSKHYLRLPDKTIMSFEELEIRLNNWLAVVRAEDIRRLKSKHTWYTENPFIRRLNSAEWFDLTRRNNLITDNNQNSRILKYRYYRPGQIPSSSQPQSRAVEIQSLFKSPEKKFDWLASIPRKDIDIPAAKKPLENHFATKRPTLPKEPPQISKKKQKLLGQITIDDDEMKSTDDIQDAKQNKNNIEVTTKCTTLFKYGSGKDSISLSMGDIGKLSPEQLLNDSIIEFYLRFLAQEYCQMNDDVYIFNTFLYPRLIANPNKSVTNTTLRSIVNRKAWLKKNYGSVKRWTKNVNIFSKKFLIIPVNYEDHWYVVIVQNPGNAIKKGPTVPVNANVIEKQEPISFEDACTIFLFNSLHILKCPILNMTSDVIKEYLALEYNDKHQNPEHHFSSKHLVQVAVNDISGQQNLVDCGVFLLAYTELFLTWTPKIQGFVFNFNNRWPLFQETQMAHMRYKILAIIKSKVSRQMWKQLEDFESKEHENGLTTEQRLLEQLQRRGLRRWKSQTCIRERMHFRKRSKSLDRVDPDDHLNPTWDPNLY